jgi:hypothetical protein
MAKNLLLVAAVVLVAKDLATFVILLTVDLRVFLRRQLAAIRLAIGLNFMMDRRFLALHFRGFVRRHRAVRDAVADTLLLALLAFIDLVFGEHGGSCGKQHRPHRESRYEMLDCACHWLIFASVFFLSEARLFLSIPLLKD